MIEAHDLRIGNYVSTTDTLIPIHKIKAGDLVSITNGHFKRLDLQINPIPLTQEWLIKFGFEFLRRQGGTQGVFSNGLIDLILSNSGNIYYKIKILPYVHKLQNLYYALKDEELTINN